MSSSSPLLTLSAVERHFGAAIRVLDEINLRVLPGDSIAITGASGSGKSTLLNILGLLDRPSSGSMVLKGMAVAALNLRMLTTLRSKSLGFVFQDSLVDPSRTALENVELGLRLAGMERKDRQGAAFEALKEAGVNGKADTPSNLLSGGERQRVAIARAIAHAPSVLLCDEPTGNLDPRNAILIRDLIMRQATSERAVVIATHDMEVAAACARWVKLDRGRLIEVTE